MDKIDGDQYTKSEFRDFLGLNRALIERVWILERADGYVLGFTTKNSSSGVLCKQRRADRDSGPRVFRTLDSAVALAISLKPDSMKEVVLLLS